MSAFATRIREVELELSEKGIPFLQEEPLKNHTTFRIGGPASIFCTPESKTQLIDAACLANRKNLPSCFLGRGSNVLFRDEGYRGMIIATSNALKEILQCEEGLCVGAGASITATCLAAQKAELAGLEFANGIPGTLGGAIYMNAGAYGGEMKDVLRSVTYVDETGAENTVDSCNLALGYRTSLFQRKPWCILSAVLDLRQGKTEEILALMEHNRKLRDEKQPMDLPSAGSAFKRPDGNFAGALIDRSGLRGYRVGDAAISEKHCGFIVNLGKATCQDVLTLMETVQGIVLEKTGYLLEKEIRVISAESGMFCEIEG